MTDTQSVIVAIAILTVIVISAWKASGGEERVLTPRATTTAVHRARAVAPATAAPTA